MYEAFYGFRDNPFRLTPDPDYLFLSTNHQEALGHLLFGVSEGSGVVVITGEIGTGKTTLLRTLIRNLDAHTTVAYIFNPALSALELLQTINTDLGLPATSASKKELIDELNRFLLTQRAAERRVVIIVDEAQDLEPAVLEQLRLLSNLETERDKLVQIILVGQPELRAMLARPELAQLDQRITLRWHLEPLAADETAAYVRHRLHVATGEREPVYFTPSALRCVYHFSHGIPRLINVLCHRALLLGYTREERQIRRATVHQAARELRSQQRTPRWIWRWNTATISLLSSAGTLLLAMLLFSVLPLRAWWTRLPSLSPPLFMTQVPAVSSHAEDPSLTRRQLAHVDPSSLPATGDTLLHEGPVVPDDVFLEALQQSDLTESAVQATNGLLRLWNVEDLQPHEWQDGALDLDTIAQVRQLEHLPFNGSLRLLALLDLPAIVELLIPGRQEMRFVLLMRITDDRCRVLLDREYDISLRALRNNWFGQGQLFWKDYENVGGLLTVGSVGQSVKRLHTLLSKAQAFNGAGSQTVSGQGIFNHETEKAVARFQKAQRLTPDGVVGPLTMISLYKFLPGYPHPSLKTTQEGSITTEYSPEAPPAAHAVRLEGQPVEGDI